MAFNRNLLHFLSVTDEDGGYATYGPTSDNHTAAVGATQMGNAAYWKDSVLAKSGRVTTLTVISTASGNTGGVRMYLLSGKDQGNATATDGSGLLHGHRG